MNRPYQICVRCVMDTTDTEISFSAEGSCCHCHAYALAAKRHLRSEATREKDLEKVVADVKRRGRGRAYDCVIGVSGGLDSTYLAYRVKELGLRPLAVHLDNGWNSELAVANIEKAMRALSIDLYTHVIDWEEFRDLQIAFLRASTPDIEIPTDHAIVALLYRVACKERIPSILLGTNVRTEAVLPRSWAQGHGDWRYIRSIHRMHGSKTLATYPHYSLWDLFYFKVIRRIRIVSILNYFAYERSEAIQTLERAMGWKAYEEKHFESLYTRFLLAFFLPTKFGVDIRRAHFSNLICSGQMSREDALRLLATPVLTPKQVEDDRLFVRKKLGLSEEEFQRLMKAPARRYRDYPSYGRIPLYAASRAFASRLLNRS